MFSREFIVKIAINGGLKTDRFRKKKKNQKKNRREVLRHENVYGQRAD